MLDVQNQGVRLVEVSWEHNHVPTFCTHSMSGTRTVWFPLRDTTTAGVSGVASISASTASAPILAPCKYQIIPSSQIVTSIFANSTDPDEMALKRAISSGSMLFAIPCVSLVNFPFLINGITIDSYKITTVVPVSMHRTLLH